MAAERPTAGPFSAVIRILGCVWKACVISRLLATKERSQWRRMSEVLVRSGVERGTDTSAPLGRGRLVLAETYEIGEEEGRGWGGCCYYAEK